MMDPELLQEFVSESRDMIDEIEPTLIELHQNAEETQNIDEETINAIFRLFHSMKGSAAFMGLSSVASVTHEAETLLDLFRKGKATLKTENVGLLCRTLDFLRKLVESIEENLSDEGHEPEAETITSELFDMINLERGGGSPASTKKAKKPSAPKKTSTSTQDAAMMDSLITPEMAERFASESDELLQQTEEALLAMEGGSNNSEIINEAFRAIHSIKGNAGFMGLADIERLSHKSETLLDAMRDGVADIDSGNCGMLLSIIDILREAVEDNAGEGDGSIAGCEVMMQLLEDSTPAEYNKPVEIKGAPEEPAKVIGPKILLVDDEEAILEPTKIMLEAGSPSYPTITCNNPKDALKILQDSGDEFGLLLTDVCMPGMNAQELIRELRKINDIIPVMAFSAQADHEGMKTLIDVGVDCFLDKPFDMDDLRKKVAEAIKKGRKREAAAIKKNVSKDKPKSVVRRDIRVDLTKLDALINLVGELVIAEAMVTGHPSIEQIEDDEGLERAIHNLKHITTELQDVAMGVRMIPLSGTFRKMIRVVHDVSTRAKKNAKLTIIGEDTEVDKTVIEQIGDPLVHIVRNSVDHGLESAEERVRIGKPETGNVTIEGRHEGGEVWILISDDGAGLDKDRIFAKAKERGLVSGNPEDIKDEEIFRLIFEPGFSTAAQVTDVSGRGVGMDVVKKNIEKLKGRVDVRSAKGKGTVITLRIPLTLAIIEGMLVRVGESCYTIPMLSIQESFQPEESMITNTPDGSEMVSLREELLPVVRLHEVFNKKTEVTSLHDGILVVIDDNDRKLCLFIDEIMGQQQTVIKGLSDYIGNARGISGCTILSDGQISLILDICGIIEIFKERSLACNA